MRSAPIRRAPQAAGADERVPQPCQAQMALSGSASSAPRQHPPWTPGPAAGSSWRGGQRGRWSPAAATRGAACRCPPAPRPACVENTHTVNRLPHWKSSSCSSVVDGAASPCPPAPPPPPPAGGTGRVWQHASWAHSLGGRSRWHVRAAATGQQRGTGKREAAGPAAGGSRARAGDLPTGAAGWMERRTVKHRYVFEAMPPAGNTTQQRDAR